MHAFYRFVLCSFPYRAHFYFWFIEFTGVFFEQKNGGTSACEKADKAQRGRAGALARKAESELWCGCGGAPHQSGRFDAGFVVNKKRADRWVDAKVNL